MNFQELKWTTEWPTEKGNYFFYGWPYGNENRDPELNYVEVRKIGSGEHASSILICSGQFWYKTERGKGLFAKVPEINLPVELLRLLA